MVKGKVIGIQAPLSEKRTEKFALIDSASMKALADAPEVDIHGERAVAIPEPLMLGNRNGISGPVGAW